MKKHHELPRTSRINDRIIEYWQKYGRERDLEKFMRLYSPASSQHSGSVGAHCSGDSEERHSCAVTTTITSTTTAAATATTTTMSTSGGNGSCACGTAKSSLLCDCDANALRCLFNEKSDKRGAVQLTHTHKSVKLACHGMPNKSKCYSTLDLEMIIPIAMEQSKAVGDNYICASADELSTPQKNKKSEQRHYATQTPDSVVKIHKRLEWDSLADVGYKKSMSTSNISTLERSLLKELYNEGALPVNDSPTHAKAYTSDTELKLNPQAVPLASSTFVDRSTIKANILTQKQHVDHSAQTGARSSTTKQLTKAKKDATDTSSRKKITDKSAQNAAKGSTKRQKTNEKYAQTLAQEQQRLKSAQTTTERGIKLFQDEHKQRLVNKNDKRNSEVQEFLDKSAQTTVQRGLTLARQEAPDKSAQTTAQHGLTLAQLEQKDKSAQTTTQRYHTVSRQEALDKSAQTTAQHGLTLAQLEQKDKSAQTTAQRCLTVSAQEAIDKSAATTSTKSSSQSIASFEKSSLSMPQRRASLLRSSSTQQDDTSTAASSTYCGGLGTPSSFEYYSSRSTSTSNNGTQPLPKAACKNEEAFIAHINEVLARRQVLGAQNKHQTRKVHGAESHRHNVFASDEDKENMPSTTSASSSSVARPNAVSEVRARELDLGVQLLCSLVDSKSLSQVQKKQLIRDIAKRLSCSELTSASSSVSDIMRASSNKPRPKGIQKPAGSNNSNSSSGSLHGIHNQRRHANAMESEFITKFDEVLVTALQSVERGQNKQQNSMAKCDKNVDTAELPIDTNVPGSHDAAKDSAAAAPVSTSSTTTASSNMRLGDTLTTTTTSTVSTTSSTTSREPTTQKVNVTSKGANIINTSSCSASDLDQASMREWLNPLTQSEIEYEQKQRELAEQAKRKKAAKKMQAAAMADNDSESERQTQLNWIESEIMRLQSLRSLLSKEAEELMAARKQLERFKDSDSTNDEGIYDSVHTINGHDVEVIIEQTEDLVIDKRKALKEERMHKSQTHIIYDKPNVPLHRETEHTFEKRVEKLQPTDVEQAPDRPLPKTPSPTTIISDDALPKVQLRNLSEPPTLSAPVLPQPPKTASAPMMSTRSQRSRMDTPTGFSSTGGGSESVCSFVQQRKRQFMEHYKNKKKEHLDALLLQQRQQQEEREREREERRKQRWRNEQPIVHHNVYDGAHHVYCAVPNMIPYTCIIENGGGGGNGNAVQPTHVYYQIVQPPQLCKHKTKATSDTATPATSAPITSKSSVVSKSTDARQMPPQQQQQPQQQCSSTTASSMFCMSSEISIPMGMHNSSEATTTTTTHQYDDVAVATAVNGIGVQTSGSMKRTRPIYSTVGSASGRIQPHPTTSSEAYDAVNLQWTSAHVGQSRTACVQVRPRAIAYVLQFEKNDRAVSSPHSNHPVSMPTNSNSDEVVLQPQLSLQDHLQRARPKFCAHSKQRKAILNHMQLLRNERRRELDEIVENTSYTSLDRKLQHLPPAPASRIRIFSTKEMKALTSKRCEILPEVVARQQREREERRRRGNRLLRDVFNRRLQRRVRSGKISLNHSRTII